MNRTPQIRCFMESVPAIKRMLSSTRRLSFLMVLALLPASPRNAQLQVPSPPTKNDPAEIARLVDDLRDVSAQGSGYNAGMWRSYLLGFNFIGVDQGHNGGNDPITGNPRPVESGTLRALVRKGLAALPQLMAHLSDARPTRVVLSPLFGHEMYFSDEYDPRQDPRRVDLHLPPKGTPDKLKLVDGYTLRVGDLCYVAIGQIVDRYLWVVHYQPPLEIVINSPVETPSLAKAVRKDWTGITPQQHLQSLYEDALWAQCQIGGGPTQILDRMLVYYPANGEELALKLLRRPLYNSQRAWDFFRHKLEGADAKTWKTSLQAYTAQYGQAQADGVLALLVKWTTAWDHGREAIIKDKAAANRALKQLFPGVPLGKPIFVNAGSTEECDGLIHNLAWYPSAKIDEEVYRIYQTMLVHPLQSWDDDWLILDCIHRLRGKGHDEQFKDYCRRRMRQLKGPAEAEPHKDLPKDIIFAGNAKQLYEAFKEQLERLSQQ